MKQEKIEEVAERHTYGNAYQNFIRGAEWQAGKMYSEEDMLNFAWFLVENIGQYSDDRAAHFEGKYLEQFKKKA
jgi:hypothetical protein